MNKERIKQLFTEVAKKASAALAAGNIHRPQPGIVTSSLLIRNGLIFHSEVADAFFKNVEEASELAKVDPAWSKSAVDRIFSKGLASVADGLPVNEAANELFRELNRRPENFGLRFSVFGLAASCGGAAFGRIIFSPGTFIPAISHEPFFKKDTETTVHYAEIEVQAIDLESAKLRAENVVDRHLAILNILCAEGAPARCFLSRQIVGFDGLTMWQERKSAELEVGWSLSRLRRLITSDEWREIQKLPYIERLSSLLRSESPFAEHLSTALELAGGTLREEFSQNAFLLLAIALESALMGGKSEQEISNQFAVRVVLLSSGTAEQRTALYKRVKRLYKIRSAIVHRGSRSVTERDLVEMREICMGCLLVLCASQEFSSISSFDELDNWFVEQMLTGPTPKLYEDNRNGQ